MQPQVFSGITRRNRSILAPPTILLLLILVLSACGSQAASTGGPPGTNSTPAGNLPSIDPNNPQAALGSLQQRVFSVGPYGEPATPASQVQLTPAELQKIQGRKTAHLFVE
jgi:hypothetical protein